MPTATTRMKAVCTQREREGGVSLGNVGFGGGCTVSSTEKSTGNAASLRGLELGFEGEDLWWNVLGGKSCSGPGTGAWIGGVDALWACSSSLG